MASPFVRVDADGQIVGGLDGKYSAELKAYLDAIRDGTIAVAPKEIATHTGGTIGNSDLTLNGQLLDSETYDITAITLTAGVTYTFAQRGSGADPLEDPYLLLANSGGTVIADDDDGGLGRSAMITYTPTTTGTYLIAASSWYHLATTQKDPGTDYTLDVWISNAANDVGGTTETALDIGLGTTFSNLEAPGDVDVYQVELTEGLAYTFVYNGGIASGGDWEDPTTPGESIGIIELLNANGDVINSFANYESGISFGAEESGTYYVRVSGLEPTMTGGYTLDVAEYNPADYDPLESLNWDSANNIPTVLVDDVPTAYVYFAPAGENFGELADDGETPMTTYGWTQKEMDAVMLALEQYTPITGINYEITTDVNQATFRLLTTSSELYGAYFYPQDEDSYGSQMGIGVFNVDSGGWDKPGVSQQDIPGDQVSLDQGGFAFGVILHEFGHAHGIAHPHDTGGGSEVMLGVFGSTGSYGLYDLNQGVYTVMSYNDAWDFHPDGPSSFTIAGINNGWSGTLSAFDIAVLQARYGVHDHNEGNTTYALTDVVDDAFYQTIWDSGGTDEISYGGARDAHIDLTAATLDYSPTGGGTISFLHNLPGLPGSQEIKGGYTIANGVVIENASGGSGDDALLGNSANNQLRGNAGDDFLLGRGGDDKLLGGDGADILNGEAGNDQLFGGAGNDLFVFTEGGTDMIKDYQAGEQIDLSALGVTEADITIKKQFVLVDLDGQDLRIMFDTKNFSMDDIIFGDEAASATAASGSEYASANHFNPQANNNALMNHHHQEYWSGVDLF